MKSEISYRAQVILLISDRIFELKFKTTTLHANVTHLGPARTAFSNFT